jgi:hypothetical protein
MRTRAQLHRSAGLPGQRPDANQTSVVALDARWDGATVHDEVGTGATRGVDGRRGSREVEAHDGQCGDVQGCRRVGAGIAEQSHHKTPRADNGQAQQAVAIGPDEPVVAVPGDFDGGVILG